MNAGRLIYSKGVKRIGDWKSMSGTSFPPYALVAKKGTMLFF